MKLCLECRRTFTGADWKCPKCAHQPTELDAIPAFAPELVHGNDGFREESFDQLAELEANNFWFKSRNQLISWALRHYFPTAKSLLEIGCGTGYVLSGLQAAHPEMEFAGSEVFLQGMAWARHRLPGVRLFQMDARRIPFVAEFDVVGAFDVVEHIEEDEEVLKQLFQAVKPGGGVLITVPQHRFLWSEYDEYGHHKRRYERRELTDKVRAAGFSVLRTTSFVTLLLPLMVVSRFMCHRRVANYDPLSELRIGSFLNKLLESVLTAERVLLKRGVSYPMGGSLLLAAKRDH